MTTIRTGARARHGKSTSKEVVVLNPDRGHDRAQGGRGAVRALGAVDEKNARNHVLFREVNEHIAGWAVNGATRV
jgi:hypothetical protein